MVDLASRGILSGSYDCVSTMMEEGTQEDLVALKLKHTHTHFLLSCSFRKKKRILYH